MRDIVKAGCAAAVLAACLGGVKLTEDPPPVRPATSGDVSGAIKPASGVESLSAVSRVTGKTYPPAEFNKAAGTFLFKSLPGAATYDIVVKTADGRSIEGIDLDFVDQEMLQQAQERRKELKLPPERQKAFDAADVAELLKYVKDLQDFCDIRRAIYIAGHGRRATMLVELMAEHFYDQKPGELIWRVELWYFEYQFGGWERVANQERVLQRQRMQKGAWQQIDVEYYPQLSVHVPRDGKAPGINFTIPDKPDISCGRPAKTEPVVQTEPHVLGLDKKPETTTKPE